MASENIPSIPNKKLDAIRRQLERRYPEISIDELCMAKLAAWKSRPGRWRQCLRVTGSPNALLGAGLFSVEQLAMFQSASLDGRRPRPRTEFGDQIYVYRNTDGTLEATLFTDTLSPDDDELRARRVDSVKLRGQVSRMLKRFARKVDHSMNCAPAASSKGGAPG